MGEKNNYEMLLESKNKENQKLLTTNLDLMMRLALAYAELDRRTSCRGSRGSAHRAVELGEAVSMVLEDEDSDTKSTDINHTNTGGSGILEQIKLVEINEEEDEG